MSQGQCEPTHFLGNLCSACVDAFVGHRGNRQAQLVGSSISCFVLPDSSLCDSGIFPPSRLSVCSFGGVCVLNIPCLFASLFPVQTMFPFQYDPDATDVLTWVQINKSGYVGRRVQAGIHLNVRYRKMALNETTNYILERFFHQ